MTEGVERLIADARGGDSAALGALLDSYRGYLRVLAQVEIGRQLQGKLDASDVVQEAFLDAHRYFPAFRGEGGAQLVGWLREILAGTLSNAVRRYLGTQARDVRLEQSLAAGLDQSSRALNLVPADPGASPSELVAGGEQALRVAAALGRLPADYRDVLTLRHLEGLTFPEVAARMGRSVDSVEKLWVRGLARLRQAFGENP